MDKKGTVHVTLFPFLSMISATLYHLLALMDVKLEDFTYLFQISFGIIN